MQKKGKEKKVSLNRAILAIAIPAIVANITTPLLGLVDMAITGHMGSAVFIAAIALGGTIFSMIYWVFGFLRMGTSGMTAQAVGARDEREMSAVFYRAMAVALSIGAVLIAAQCPIKTVLLDFMGGDAETTAIASRYFDILIYGAPATLGIYVFNGWFIGRQDSKLTMWLSLTINVVNIACSLTLVYGLGLGIDGVATGTLTAQWAGFITGAVMARRFHPGRPSAREIFKINRLKRFFSVNTDIFLRTLCLVAVTVWFTRSGARQNDTILAVNALLMQLFILFSYMMDGFAYAGEALVGKSTGANDTALTRRTIAALFRHGTVISCIFTIVYALFGNEILSVLSDDMSVVAASGDYRWWAVTVPFAGFGAFIWDGVFIGATMTRRMLVAMAIAMAIFFTVYFALFPTMGNHALWLAFILYLAARGVAQTVLYFSRGASDGQCRLRGGR